MDSNFKDDGQVFLFLFLFVLCGAPEDLDGGPDDATPWEDGNGNNDDSGGESGDSSGTPDLRTLAACLFLIQSRDSLSVLKNK